MQADTPAPDDFTPSHYRILVVDDEVALLPLMQQILGHAGFQVETAPDAYAGLELLGPPPTLGRCHRVSPIAGSTQKSPGAFIPVQ